MIREEKRNLLTTNRPISKGLLTKTTFPKGPKNETKARRTAAFMCFQAGPVNLASERTKAETISTPPMTTDV